MPYLADRVRLPAAALFVLSLILVLAAAISGCARTKVESADVPRPDPLWGEFLASHTTGVISRKSALRIVFATDVVDAKRVGQDARDSLQVRPAVEGSAAFVTTRELVFTPRGDLSPGVVYRVALKPTGLEGVPQTLPPFEFVVQTRRAEFEVSLGGLTADVAEERSMVLSGVVMTADAERADKVEALVAATYAGRPAAITWEHAPDGQRHGFRIRGLRRAASEQVLELRWAGEPIGAGNRGEREIAVPPQDRFVITQVQAAEDSGERYIAVFFSDTLDRQQDFKGLVRLSVGNASTRVDGNVLRVYSDQAAQGEVTLTIERGIRSRFDQVLADTTQYPVVFASTRPQVRFVGSGTILPQAQTLSVPFEAVGVRSVRVTAFRVHEDNLSQFLQVNTLSGSHELGRVGRNLWRKTIPLNAADLTRWNRYSLDVTELLQKYPDGLVRLTLSVRRENSAYGCDGSAAPSTEEPLVDQDASDLDDESNWDYVEEYFGVADGSDWRDRENPCKDAYYVYGQQIRDARNLLVSNLGLLAKKDQRGGWIVVATDLRTAQPLSDVRVSAVNFQHQTIATRNTNALGMAEFSLDAPPFTFVAQQGQERGYLKVQQGVALPVSHFDVGGERVAAGIKGHIYGERGVWRPGDDIHLTFVLQDKDQTLPAGHPVTLELFNPRSQLTQTLVNTTPVNGFYAFTLKTADNAPTGNWTARAMLGGATFSKVLKIETVMPNRLKVALDLQRDGNGTLIATSAGCAAPSGCNEPAKVRGTLFGQWLSGATAAGLKADVKARLTPAATRFDRYADFVFEDPARHFAGEPQNVFEGTLDDNGNASIDSILEGVNGAPGMLSAAFTSRIFERGGAYSISYSTHNFSPYRRYVGLKLPKGDVARDMLRTDMQHTVELAGLTEAGKPTDIRNVEVTLYKVEWKWWWDKSGESLAQYTQRSHSSVVQQDTVRIAAGRGEWKFEIRYPSWGRYLVRACDLDGGHCTGQTFYIDWPSWAGRAQDQSGPAASVLVFTADKEKYAVGETATIQLPEAKQGRALLTIENGTSILDARWIDLAKESNRVAIAITQAMTPNVYASVTLIQPHGRSNDRPIRLYGVIPLHVTDSRTSLAPLISVASEWRPESVGTVEVSERNRREMTYTLAVVDEGLLDLTGFRTPNLHEQFYKREALGVSTWDLFDEVAGAYSADLERLLAIGGSDSGAVKNPDERKSRFPPVVRYLGPFELQPGEKKRHEIALPRYIGAVRVMVVAGDRGAYGSAEKSVFVRQPLMLLPTLPRVLGPQEEVAVPVSVFVSDRSIGRVQLQMQTDAAFEIVGGSAVTLDFTQPQEQIATLRLRSKARIGQGLVKFSAVSGQHTAQAEVHLEVRSPNPPTTRRVLTTLEPGESWSESLVPHGLPGTNAVTLEVSAVPPLDLERRLHYLITYPYGCLEQTTSAVFPQLYLPTLLHLGAERKQQIQRNVQHGIQHLSGFQLPNGAFAYWPGGFYSGDRAIRDNWSTTYAGHFLAEARRLGYAVPEPMLNNWVRFQRATAQAWSGTGQGEVLDQAYRLYALAVANHPEVGAMNRLREQAQLPVTSRWMLAAAYELAGLADAANELVRNAGTSPQPGSHDERIFGSALRDSAIVLDSLVVLGRTNEARAVAEDVSRSLVSDDWHSTQSTAYALRAIAHYVGLGQFSNYTFKYAVDGKGTNVTASAPMYSTQLPAFPDRGAQVLVDNTAQRRLFVTLTNRGIAASGNDRADASGLSLEVDYRDEQGRTLDVARLPQGSDLISRIVVTNTTAQRIENIALAQLVPAGWEIHNERMEGLDAGGERDNSSVPGQPWWSQGATAADSEYVDIRDDRIYRHFSLKPQQKLIFTTRLNAAYRGRYYMPSIAVEAMYDAGRFARTKGQWVEVVEQSQAR